MTASRLSRLAAPCLAASMLAIGIVIGGWLPSVRPLPPVFAVTSQADASFAVCTAPLDIGVEGFFVLDFMTGELSGGVLGQNSKFVGGYKHNVLKDLDFKPGQAKNPRFLLVSGMVDGVRRRAGIAQSVLYVTDTDTGTTAAYSIPWNQQRAQSGTPFVEGLDLLDVARPRGGGAKAP
jgi:hypothetical protein